MKSTIKLSGDELEREASEFLYPAVDIHSEFLKTLVDSEPRWMEEAVDVIMRNRVKVQESFEKNLEKWVKECTDRKFVVEDLFMIRDSRDRRSMRQKVRRYQERPRSSSSVRYQSWKAQVGSIC